MKSDIALRHVFQRPPSLLLSQVIGKEIAVKRILPTEMFVIRNLRPDVLFETEDGEIIHVELHGYPFDDFGCRNLIYYGLVLRDYKRPPIQVVFWIGPGKVGIPDGVRHPPRLDYSYLVIDVRELDGEFLLESGDVSEAIFAVLCKLSNVREAIARIAGRIRALPPQDQRAAIAELLILSGLRGLTELVKEEISDMPIEIDIHENEFLEGIWQQALRKGEEKGREVGREEGREEGSETIARELLYEILHARFGTIADPSIARRIAGGRLSDLRLWASRALSARDVAAGVG